MNLRTKEETSRIQNTKYAACRTPGPTLLLLSSLPLGGPCTVIRTAFATLVPKETRTLRTPISSVLGTPSSVTLPALRPAVFYRFNFCCLRGIVVSGCRPSLHFPKWLRATSRVCAGHSLPLVSSRECMFAVYFRHFHLKIYFVHLFLFLVSFATCVFLK